MMEATVAPKRQQAAPKRRTVRRVLKPIVWAGALVPLAILLAKTFLENLGPWGRLGANPIEKVTHWTGYTALVLLMVTLAVTPIRRLTGWNEIIKLRRLIGLFAFFYATLHFLIYIVLDQFFSLPAIAADILERPYITVGFTAFVLLIPLAATSTKNSIRRLGKRWQTVHRLIYVSAALGVLHFFWKVKADTREPLIFAFVLAVLLLLRLPIFRTLRQQRLRSNR